MDAAAAALCLLLHHRAVCVLLLHHRSCLLVALLSLSLQMFQAKLEQISSPRTDRLIAKISVENMTPPPPSSDETPLVLLAQALFPEFAARSPAADADAAETAKGRVLLVGLKPVTDEHLAGFPALELVAGISVGVDHLDLAAADAVGST
jgi:hypothetical protein